MGKWQAQSGSLRTLPGVGMGAKGGSLRVGAAIGEGLPVSQGRPLQSRPPQAQPAMTGVGWGPRDQDQMQFEKTVL